MYKGFDPLPFAEHSNLFASFWQKQLELLFVARAQAVYESDLRHKNFAMTA